MHLQWAKKLFSVTIKFYAPRCWANKGSLLINCKGFSIYDRSIKVVTRAWVNGSNSDSELIQVCSKGPAGDPEIDGCSDPSRRSGRAAAASSGRRRRPTCPGQPGDSLDIAVALAREAIDGLRSRHHGTRFLIDPGDPQARRRLRDDGELPVSIRERGIVLELRLLRQADSMRGLPAPVSRANEYVDTTASLPGAVPWLPSHRAYRYSRPPRHAWARPSKPLFAFWNLVCSRVQRRKRPARSYSATKPRRSPSKSSIASIRQNTRPCLVVDGDVLETQSQDSARA